MSGQSEEYSTFTIESLGAQGDGIARSADGRKIFVAGALPGEIVRAAPGKEQGGAIHARLLEVVAPSVERAMPACRHFGTCGGCALQHMRAEDYATFKAAQVRTMLARAGLEPGEISGPFISPPAARRRASFAAYHGKDKIAVGFNRPQSNLIVDQEECPVLKPRLAALVPPLRQMMGGILLEGHGMDIAVTESRGDVDMLLRPWVRQRKGDPGDVVPRHVTERLAAFAEGQNIARIFWQPDAGNDGDVIPVIQRHRFTVDFSGVPVAPPPGGFLQATEEGEAALVQAVREALSKKTKKIIDLYAGCGTFTFALAGAGYKVHAVEGFAPACDALRAAMPGRPVSAERRDLAQEPLLARELNVYDAVVLDPPRVGAGAQIRMIARSDVPRVVYVSCNPASFSKDAAALVAGGYRFGKLTMVDQFLWSPHIELAGVFIKEK